ncbi:MAG: hypothetical protein V4668_02505 [Patescibacteria group bacterium]
MKKIIQKTTRTFSVPSLDKKSSKSRSSASQRSSFAIENILFTEEDLLEKTKKINPKKTPGSNTPRNESE